MALITATRRNLGKTTLLVLNLAKGGLLTEHHFFHPRFLVIKSFD
jgi:hypothetical protein